MWSCLKESGHFSKSNVEVPLLCWLRLHVSSEAKKSFVVFVQFQKKSVSTCKGACKVDNMVVVAQSLLMPKRGIFACKLILIFIPAVSGFSPQELWGAPLCRVNRALVRCCCL